VEFPVSDPILIFTILISVILIAPLLAERLRIPDLVLLLLAGTLLGPHGSGILARNQAITLFGSVGLLYIMFLAGLEIDLHRFARTRGRSIAFGLMTFAIPQGVGTLLGRYVLAFDWPAAILLASMFASHTLLAYPVASKLGIAKREPVAVTVGATIITDILALLVLAVIADSAKGISLTVWFWIGIALGMVALSALTWWGIPWLSRWFFHHVPEKGGAQFLFVIAIVCGFAYLSHYAKMEPIIGAFLAGAAFNRLIPAQSALMNRVEFAGNTLFIPFFLISVGMLMDPAAVVVDPKSGLVGATMVAGVVATKWTAASLARFLFHYRPEEGRVMFGLSVVQAAATLAAMLVGYDLGIFDESVLNGAIAMILVTCPLGSWVVDRYGRQMAAQSPGQEPIRYDTQRLLVPVAKPDSATRLLDLAFLLRNPALPGAIHPIAVVHEGRETEEAVAEGEKLLAACLAHAAAADIPVSPGVRVGLNVSDGIVRAAKELRADMVLIGWGGERTVVKRIFGTLLENLLGACPPRIVLCRVVRPFNTVRRLLLPLPLLAERRGDISEILRDAKYLAGQIGADLHVFLSEGPSTQTLHAMIEAARPPVPVRIVSDADWRGTRTRLFAEIRADDMTILPAERRDSPLWSPTRDRFPEAAATRYPQMNLLVFYSALYDAIGLSAAETVSDIPEVIPVCRRIETSDIEDALRLMMSVIDGWNEKEKDAVWSLLADSARGYPVEITPGIVLLHTHTAVVTKATLLVGFGTPGWTFTGMASPARIVLALLSPAGQAPEHHLKVLGHLAQSFHNTETAEALRTATSATEVCRILGQKFPKRSDPNLND